MEALPLFEFSIGEVPLEPGSPLLSLVRFTAHKLYHVIAVLGSLIVLLSSRKLGEHAAMIRLVCIAGMLDGMAGVMRLLVHGAIPELARVVFEVGATCAVLVFVVYAMLWIKRIDPFEAPEREDAIIETARKDLADLAEIRQRHA